MIDRMSNPSDLPAFFGGQGTAPTMLYSSASRKWIENLCLGASFDGESIISAMMAASVSHADASLAPIHKSWKGSRVNDVSIPDTYDSFEKEFGAVFHRANLWSSHEQLTTDPDGVTYAGEFGAVVLNLGKNHNSADVYVAGQLDMYERLCTWMNEHFTEKPEPGTVYMMVLQKGNVKLNKVGTGGKPLERGNYMHGVLDAYDRIREDLISENPRGRLSIISGPAGTGKTHLLRAMLQEVNEAIFVVVPQNALGRLMDPEGLTALTELRDNHVHEERTRPIVLLLEDADDALAPRKDGDTNTISALLNLGDGITGSVLDVRLLATTNRYHQEFDEAVMRPGRLGTAIEVGPLSPGKAMEIYERLTGIAHPKQGCPILTCSIHTPYGDMFTKETTLAEVYSKAFDNGFKSPAPKNRKMGF